MQLLVVGRRQLLLPASPLGDVYRLVAPPGVGGDCWEWALTGIGVAGWLLWAVASSLGSVCRHRWFGGWFRC